MLNAATGRSPDFWRFSEGKFGKPHLSRDCAMARLQFSISHVQGFVACAIAAADVGVDIERVDRPVDLSLAEQGFAPQVAS